MNCVREKPKSHGECQSLRHSGTHRCHARFAGEHRDKQMGSVCLSHLRVFKAEINCQANQDVLWNARCALQKAFIGNWSLTRTMQMGYMVFLNISQRTIRTELFPPSWRRDDSWLLKEIMAIFNSFVAFLLNSLSSKVNLTFLFEVCHCLPCEILKTLEYLIYELLGQNVLWSRLNEIVSPSKIFL